MNEQTVHSTSGTCRSSESGKLRFDLCFPPTRDACMLTRLAKHMTAHVGDRGDANWYNASTDEDLQRFRRSAFRHFMQWWYGEDDEDHAAALLFNVQGAEYVRSQTASAATGQADGVKCPQCGAKYLIKDNGRIDD